MFIDSHCHLDMLDDVQGALARAKAAGIGAILHPCVSVDDFEKVLGVAASFPNIYAAFGVHPDEITSVLSALEIEKFASDPLVAAIGETGLDYHYAGFDKAAQAANFSAHIKAAQRTGKPLIIHSRDADEDTVAMLREHYAEAPFRAILHCFAGGDLLLDTALELGFYVSASGVITYPSAEELRGRFAKVPLERLLIETDAPFLAPQAFRGQKNEPAFIVETASALAQVKGVSLEEIESATERNFFAVIG